MEIKASIHRDQISFGSIEDSIEKDNPVRLIEAIVEHIDLKELSIYEPYKHLKFLNLK